MDALKRLLDLLPLIQQGPAWLRVLFLAWLVATAALVVGLAAVVTRPTPAAGATPAVGPVPREPVPARRGG